VARAGASVALAPAVTGAEPPDELRVALDRSADRDLNKLAAEPAEREERLDLARTAVRNLFASVSADKATLADPPGGHAVFNVGATQATVTEIIDAVRRVTGRRVPVRRHPPRTGESRALRAGGVSPGQTRRCSVIGGVMSERVIEGAPQSASRKWLRGHTCPPVLSGNHR